MPTRSRGGTPAPTPGCRGAVLVGCNDYVVKPPDEALLLGKVRALLEAARYVGAMRQTYAAGRGRPKP